MHLSLLILPSSFSSSPLLPPFFPPLQALHEGSARRHRAEAPRGAPLPLCGPPQPRLLRRGRAPRAPRPRLPRPALRRQRRAHARGPRCPQAPWPVTPGHLGALRRLPGRARASPQLESLEKGGLRRAMKAPWKSPGDAGVRQALAANAQRFARWALGGDLVFLIFDV